MKRNVGKTDKALGIIAALVIAVLYFTGVIGGTLGSILLTALPL
jgi:hypothetical protein